MIACIQEATQAGTQAPISAWSGAVLSAGVVAAVIGLVGVIVGQFLTGRRHSETLRLTEQGQITERFTRAIDQLGATDADGKPKLEIQLGGIYALERIAKDSPDRDYSTVMEVLTAYAREHASLFRSEVPEPSAAIRVIGDVIRRLHGKGGIPEKCLVQIDLHDTNLKGIDFKGVDFKGANLDEANLQGANLQRANLQGANLQGANLKEYGLKESYVEGAFLRSRRLYGADLYGANLQGANLKEANLQGAVLKEANLKEADLQGAVLKEANLQGAVLKEANLRGAYLQKADLQFAKGLIQRQLAKAIGDETTELPQGFERPKLWT